MIFHLNYFKPTLGLGDKGPVLVLLPRLRALPLWLCLELVPLLQIECIRLVTVETVRLNILLEGLNDKKKGKNKQARNGACTKLYYLAMFEFRQILNPCSDALVDKPLLEGAPPQLADGDLDSAEFPELLLQNDK